MDNKDILIEFCKVNNDYHNKKEDMVWLSSSLYFGFSTAFIIFLVQNKSIVLEHKIYLIIFSVLVLLFSSLFVFIQNWYKSKSIFIYSKIVELLRLLDKENYELKLYEIIEVNETNNAIKCFGRFRMLKQNGKPGLLVLGIMLIFGITQIFLIFL